jgi:hypothetical protein
VSERRHDVAPGATAGKAGILPYGSFVQLQAPGRDGHGDPIHRQSRKPRRARETRHKGRDSTQGEERIDGSGKEYLPPPPPPLYNKYAVSTAQERL